MKEQIIKFLDKYILPIIIGILAISASIFISRALYNEDGKEIESSVKTSFSLVKQFNYEENGQEKSLIEFNLKEKPTYTQDYYSPVKENSTYLKIPEINGIIPDTIDVVSISSKATNGKDEQREAKYEYDKGSKILHIYDNNEANENGETYSGSTNDYDEYEIIFNYNQKIELTEENSKITMPVLIRYESQNEEIGRIQDLTNNEITLSESGNIVSTKINTQDIYNGYINSNISNGTNYSTEFYQNNRVIVSKLVDDEITLEETNEFKTEDNEYKETNDITYKQIKINKQDLTRVLGDVGTLQVLDNNENILLDINKDYKTDDNEITLNFESEVTGLTFKISKPANKGIIRIQETKEITPNMKDLKNKYVVTKNQVISGNLENLTVDETEIKDAVTKVNTSIDKTEWTSNIQNDVKITATLVTSKSDCNLFKNPTLQIELPSAVEKVVIGDSYLLNANGLELKDVNVVENQDGKKVIVAQIYGTQTEYLFDNMIDGTNVVIPATIILNKEFTSYSDNVSIKYTNEIGKNTESGENQITVNLQSITENKKENKTEETNNNQSNANQEDGQESNNQQNNNASQETAAENNNEPARVLSKVETLKQNNGLSVIATAQVGQEIVAKETGNAVEKIDDQSVYERQVIKYEVTVKNNTNETINNIAISGEVPNYTKYATIESGKHWSEELKKYVYNIQDDLVYNYITDETVKNYQFKNITALEPGETKTEYYEVVVGDLENETVAADISNNISVNVDDENYDTYTLKNKILQAKIDIKLKAQTSGTDMFAYKIDLTNLTDSDLNNIHVETTEIPEELKYTISSVMYTDGTTTDNGKIEDDKFKIDIPNIKANSLQSVIINFSGANYEENKNQIELKMAAAATVDGTEYISNENRIYAYPQYVKATMSLDQEGQNVKPDDELTYKITVKNESKVRTNVTISDNLPKDLEGIEATYLSYNFNENKVADDGSIDKRENYDIEAEENAQYELVENKIDLSVKKDTQDDINITTVIPAGKTITIMVKVRVDEVDQNTEISNFVTVSGVAINTVTSNIVKVTAITNVDWDYIDGKKDDIDDGDDSNDNEDNNNNSGDNSNDNNGGNNNGGDNNSNSDSDDNGNNNNGNNSNATYSISGITWLDENEDGRRIENEKKLNGITVKLFDAETNSIVTIDNKKMIAQVDNNGEYKFENIPSGRYYCLFEYDTSKYEITKYQVKGVDESLNNDANKSQVTIDGVAKEVGITDILQLNKDLENIDLGLVENKVFDLKLEKNISKVTVSNSKGNKEYDYKNISLAKVEIPKKQLEGSIVKIEYNIIVTNEGTLEGYANEVTDYLPDGLTLDNSNSNGWTVNKDGSLKNTSLASKTLEPGESKTLKLYLTKTLTSNSVGITKNSAEITKSSNAKNLKDVDSTAGNKVQSEDDYDSADILISVSTGLYRNTLIIILIGGGIYLLIRVIRKYNKKFPTIMMMIMATVLIGTTVSHGWTEEINWVGEGGQLSNGWHCTWTGAHQCAVASHTYSCSNTGYYVVSSSSTTLKTITLTKESSTKKFTYLNSDYNIVGPYKIKCNYDIKSSTITATVAGASSYSICDSSGNATSWTSGKNKTFYVKVPKAATAVTKVKVTVTVEKATKVTTDWEDDYSATCISISGQHQNGSNVNISTSTDACQTAGKTYTKQTESEEDGKKSVSWGPIYAGSLIIRKYDAEKKKDDGSDYELKKTCGAKFTVTDSAGHVVATNVTPKQTIKGLPPDTYTVTETEAPTNYNLSLQTGTTKSKEVSGGVGAGNEPSTVTFKFYNQKYVDLELSKVDEDDGSGIEGIGFTVYDNAHKKYITSDGKQTDTETTIYTDKNGKISINNIKMYDNTQTFTVKEVESKNLYYKSDKTITATLSCKKGSPNYKAKETIKNKKPYSLTIEKKDPDKTDQNLTAYFYVQYEDGTWLTQGSKYQNSASSIKVTKSLKLAGLKRGKYHIWEYKTPTGYDITQQDNYGADSSHPTWVDCGTHNVGVNSSGNEDNNVATITVKRNNKKWIRHVTGFVWQENPSGKANGFDNVFGSGDQKLSGIKVEFIKKNGTVLKTTTTGSDGSYSFTFFKEVLYWDLRDYMVRFTFDNGTYSTVRADLAVESRNASRALESHEWSNDSYATGSGIATTIPDASTLEESIAKYYNEDNYTIETLNLGLMKKANQEYSIIENLDKVILKKGNYKFTYEYGKKAIVQDIPQNPGIYDRVAIQNSSASFTQKLYPSDIAYNNTVSENKFEVYVDYNITITNTMTINIEDVYMEKSLNITSLTNTFNSELYEISQESSSSWQGNGGGNVKYKNSISPIGPGGNVTIPIQFKVKETGLQQIIQGSKYNPNIYKDCATVAIANGYHIYERYDYSWGYKPSPYRVKHQHRTANQELRSGTITLRLTLAEQRTISGNVFEDTQTAESARDHTRVGNGLYDNSERKVKAVKVALLNKSDESVSKLYSTEGNYLRQEGNIWKFTPQEGEVDVKNDGTYELKGVVTGEYYLRFTYSNGTQVIVNGGANNISIMDYKSTILTGAAANYSQENWYLDVMGGTNSVATDKYYVDEGGNSSDIIKMRTESQKEINYSSKVNFNKGNIQALSEAIDVNFEYLKEHSKDYDYPFKPNCAGMNFGIIERPKVDIQLEKSIKNVKLTLSNGTNLINGNPENKNVSEFLTEVTKSYAKIETDYTNLFGSTVTVTYKLTAKNKSEIDYASSEYYRFGRKGSSAPVGTAVTKIVDYLSYKQCNYVDTTVAEDKIDVTNNDYTGSGYTKEDYFANGIMEENQKNYKDQVLKASTQYIIPEAAGRGNAEADYTVTVNKLLPSTNTTDDLGWLSYSEIIGITNPTYTTQYVSTMGSYKAGDSKKVAQGGTSENDNSDSAITITPPTGENKSYTIFIVTAGSLAVIAGGVVVIKKFVL